MKKNIAILAGGDSGEYEVSIKSGNVVKKHLDASRYNSYLIHIHKGIWEYVHDDGTKIAVDKNDFSIIVDDQKINFYGVFIAIHGTPGEDGKLQGYFDLLKIPYNTCDVITSSVTFSKHFCKQSVQQLGVKTAKSLTLRKTDNITLASILDEITLPCIVKPSNGGSSVATSRVDTADQMQPAIDLGFTEDSEILIEEFIKGTEVTNGCFRTKGEITVLPITEVITGNTFFDYEAKYQGKSEEITPARIQPDIEKQIKETTAFLYNALNCRGMVRIDYIIRDNTPYFLEVNTVPGLSEQSIIPQQARHVGYSLTDFFNLILDETIC